MTLSPQHLTILYQQYNGNDDTLADQVYSLQTCHAWWQANVLRSCQCTACSQLMPEIWGPALGASTALTSLHLALWPQSKRPQLGCRPPADQYK